MLVETIDVKKKRYLQVFLTTIKKYRKYIYIIFFKGLKS